MDISKYHIPQLTGPNWGPWYERIQSTARIINIWDAMRGNITSTTTTPPTRDLLQKPTPLTTTAMAAEVAVYTAAKTIWDQKNSQGLGLIQATISNVIWQWYETLPTAKQILDGLETEFGAAGGGTDLPPTCQYGENSNHRFDGSIATDPKLSGQL